MTKIRISVAGVNVHASLRDTPTAQRILQTLPLNSVVHTWGEEIYFEAHAETGLEADAKTVVELGEIAFWPGGDKIAIGFGRTPLSQGDEIRLASPVNIWADAVDDVRAFASVHAGAQVLVEIVA